MLGIVLPLPVAPHLLRGPDHLHPVTLHLFAAPPPPPSPLPSPHNITSCC